MEQATKKPIFSCKVLTFNRRKLPGGKERLVFSVIINFEDQEWKIDKFGV
jgi:hypothetical protein